MSDTDTAYLAIIDDLETEVKTLEMTLDGVKALYEQRLHALEAAARAVLTDDDLTAIIANTANYENWVRHRAALAALLEGEGEA